MSALALSVSYMTTGALKKRTTNARAHVRRNAANAAMTPSAIAFSVMVIWRAV
jgi:hypothetical protein